MEDGNSQAILLARRTRTMKLARPMRAGKDNLTISFIGWMNQKQVIFSGCSKNPSSKAAAV